MAPSGPKQLWELLVSPSLARWSMGPVPEPIANSGRERRKAQVDRRFQAIRASCNMPCLTGNPPYSIPPYSVEITQPRRRRQARTVVRAMQVTGFGVEPPSIADSRFDVVGGLAKAQGSVWGPRMGSRSAYRRSKRSPKRSRRRVRSAGRFFYFDEDRLKPHLAQERETRWESA